MHIHTHICMHTPHMRTHTHTQLNEIMTLGVVMLYPKNHRLLVKTLVSSTRYPSGVGWSGETKRSLTQHRLLLLSFIAPQDLKGRPYCTVNTVSGGNEMGLTWKSPPKGLSIIVSLSAMQAAKGEKYLQFYLTC